MSREQEEKEPSFGAQKGACGAVARRLERAVAARSDESRRAPSGEFFPLFGRKFILKLRELQWLN